MVLRDVGDYIREQRNAAQVSLRQLAKAAGVSNPYLSQIERGLRKPSAEILQQIAKALRISAEQLYVRAGILDERVGDDTVTGAILVDAGLTERQKQVLLEIYESFRRENAGNATRDTPAEVELDPEFDPELDPEADLDGVEAAGTDRAVPDPARTAS